MENLLKIKAAKLYAPLFSVVLLVQLYLLSFRFNIIIQLAVLGFIIFIDDRITLSKKFIQYLVPFFLLFGIGCIGMLIHWYHLFDIIKDFFHFAKPLAGLITGYVIFKRINDISVFVKTIVYTGILSAIIHFFIIAFFIRHSGEISDLREFTKDNFLELFALFFMLYYPGYGGSRIFSKRYYKNMALIILSVSCVFYFSRAMIIMAGILLLTVYGYTRISKKTITAAAIIISAVGLLYLYLFSANIRRGQPGLEGFLYKIKMAPGEIFQTRIDRENHADLWDHWRAYEAKRAFALMADNPSSFVFGTGHGSLVNLKFFAPLSGDAKGMKYISELHNGYVYILYKTGIIGLLIYILVLLRWYGYIYKRVNFITMLISACGLIYLMSSVIITGVYNARDVIIFILGGALYFAESQRKPVQGESLNVTYEEAG